MDSLATREPEAARARRPKVLLFLRPAAGGMLEEFLILAQRLPRGTFDLVACGPSDFRLMQGFHATEVPYQPLRLEPYPAAVLQLLRLVARERPALVHSHGVFAALVAHLALRILAVARLSAWGRLRRPRHVVTIHTLVSEERFGGPWGWLAKAMVGGALRSADTVIAVSQAARETLEAVFPSLRGRVEVIHNGVDVEPLLEPVNRGAMVGLLGLRGDSPHVGVVARLSREKGVEHFIRAASILSAEGLDVEYVVAGDGPLHQELLQLAHELGISAEVHFLGAQSDVHPVLAILDVLVIPSLSESFSLIGVKGALLGIPIVASRVGGLPEVLPETMARFVPPGDPEALAEAIRAVLNEIAVRPVPWLEDLGLAASALALAARTGLDLDDEVARQYLVAAGGDDPRLALAGRFAPERMVQRVHEVYERLVLQRTDTKPA